MPLPVTAPEPRLGERIFSLADVADAVVERLHSASLSRAFIAKREWLPRFDLAELGIATKVVVTSGDSYAMTRLSRTCWQRDPEIRILIIGAIDAEPMDDEIDALLAFVEEIRDLFAFSDLALGCGPEMRAVVIESDPPISTEALEQMRQFMAAIAITFRTLDSL